MKEKITRPKSITDPTSTKIAKILDRRDNVDFLFTAKPQEKPYLVLRNAHLAWKIKRVTRL